MEELDFPPMEKYAIREAIDLWLHFDVEVAGMQHYSLENSSPFLGSLYAVLRNGPTRGPENYDCRHEKQANERKRVAVPAIEGCSVV
jgi:hypothetical protein